MMTSEDYINAYLDYAESGADLSDVRFCIYDDSARIHQPIDDEEDDKYDVLRADVPSQLWDKFVATFG